MAPPVSNLDRRVSADSPHDAKLETGNSKLDSAPTALRGSETRDSGLGTRDSQSRPLPFIPVSLTSRTPFQNSAFRNPEPRVPSRAPRVSAPSLSHLTRQQLQFLLRVTPAALASERDFEIPASVTMAQAILESATSAGWGSSALFRLANNPFGIKYCHFGESQQLTANSRQKLAVSGPLVAGCQQSGKSKQSNRAIGIQSDRVIDRSSDQEKSDSEFQIPTFGCQAPSSGCQTSSSGTPAPSPRPTAEGGLSAVSYRLSAENYGAFDAITWEIENGQRKVISAKFQRFPNLDEAFRAHALLLRAPRYRPAFAVRGDWKKFAERLGPKISPLDSEHCGYSTNPSYSAEILKLVTLYRLDDPRAVQWFATGNDPGTGYGPRVTGHGPEGQVVADLEVRK